MGKKLLWSEKAATIFFKFRILRRWKGKQPDLWPIKKKKSYACRLKQIKAFLAASAVHIKLSRPRCLSICVQKQRAWQWGEFHHTVDLQLLWKQQPYKQRDTSGSLFAPSETPRKKPKGGKKFFFKNPTICWGGGWAFDSRVRSHARLQTLGDTRGQRLKTAACLQSLIQALFCFFHWGRQVRDRDALCRIT